MAASALREFRAVAEGHGAVRLLDARPAVVAVHRVVAAADGGDLPDADLLHLRFDLADVAQARSWATYRGHR